MRYETTLSYWCAYADHLVEEIGERGAASQPTLADRVERALAEIERIEKDAEAKITITMPPEGDALPAEPEQASGTELDEPDIAKESGEDSKAEAEVVSDDDDAPLAEINGRVSDEDVPTLVEIVARHPEGVKPFEIHQAIKSESGEFWSERRWQKARSAALDAGQIETRGKTNQVRYFSADAGPEVPTDRRAAILDVLSDGMYHSMRELRAALNLSANQIRDPLSELVAHGKVMRTGDGAATKYRQADQPQNGSPESARTTLEQRILCAIETPMTAADAARLVELGPSTAKTVLEGLANRGIAVRRRTDAGTLYQGVGS